MTSLPQLIISIMLFLILFFGIGFLLNMVLRSTWIMAIIYPLIVVWIVNPAALTEYFTNPAESFSTIGPSLAALQLADLAILASGLIGSIIAGISVRMLRVRGYQMF
ncbi:YuiB family protein [Natribacillus halophilus]|uniref:YuiB family protein n=1 Tax=Natribacillus halophilus TaxID=549003 RepID=UPI000B88DBF6|nr:YuiB family protein [Natribacillus halophilus]